MENIDSKIKEPTYLIELAKEHLVPFGLKVLGAIAIWVLAGLVINFCKKVVGIWGQKQSIDPTIVTYLQNALNLLLRIVLLVGILGYFGFNTTSFAALIAAVGIAIGTAWAGLLSNFASGMFLMVLRPYKVGDMIAAGGVTGDVTEIGLFATSIRTVDSLKVIVGNAKIFSDNIVNYSANPYRRVDLTCQLSGAVNVEDAKTRLKKKLAQIPNVVAHPEPQVDILEFKLEGPVLSVRPFCSNEHYWQVFFAGNAAIREVAIEANYPAPSKFLVVENKA